MTNKAGPSNFLSKIFLPIAWVSSVGNVGSEVTCLSTSAICGSATEDFGHRLLVKIIMAHFKIVIVDDTSLTILVADFF